MTLDELLIDCCTRLNYPPDLALVDQTVLNRLTAFLNQTQQEILGQPSYKGLLRMGTTILTTAGQAAYGLPGYIDRITGITDPRNQRRLGVMSTDAYRRYLPNPAVQQGTPVAYAFDGWGSLQYQPTATESIYVYSQNVVDDGTEISCMAVQPGGTPGAGSDIWVRFAVVLNFAANGVLLVPPGVVAPAFASDVSLNKRVQGAAVDLMADKPGTRFLARIAQNENRGRYCQIYLIPTPSGPMSFNVFAERKLQLLSERGAEESVLPTRFHYLLGAGARMKEYELRGDNARWSVAKREYDTGLAFLNSFVSTMPDAGDQMFPDDGRFTGPSVLGPWFPASRYRGF